AAPSDFQKKDAKVFAQNWDALYEAQEKAIKSFSKEKNLSGDAGRNAYFQTPAGQQTLAGLNTLEKVFGYDAVSAYLFDNKEMNPDLEFYSSSVEKPPRTYYIRGDRVMAVLEKRAEDDFFFKRLDQKCDLKEIVRFQTLSGQSDAAVSYQIN